MKCKTNWVTVWGCFVGLQVALNVVTFEDQALKWLESTIPVGRPAAEGSGINTTSAHQLGLW